MQKQQSDSLGRLALISLAAIFVAGVFLRLRGLSSQQIFADEIHTLFEASARGYLHIFTHFTVYDACIPLTLYNKFVMDTLGLDEILFHLPSAASGCATLLLLARMAWKRYGPVTACLASGLLAVSPYHVYLSREARPYPMAIFLLLVAIDRVLIWSESGGQRNLYVAALASSGSLYLHLTSLPVITLLFAFLMQRVSLGVRPEEKRSVRNSVLLFAVLGAAFFLPALPSLMTTLHAKVAHGRLGLATIRDGLYLPLALRSYAFIAELALAAWGVVALMKVRREETVLLAALVLFQATVVSLSFPAYADIPWVWMRYVALVLPVWFLLAAGGIEDLAKRLPLHSAPLVMASLLPLAVGLYDGKDGLYPLGRNRDFNVHPMVMAHDWGHLDNLRALPASAFYWNLRARSESHALLELPLVTVLPVYDLYQRIHHCPVFTAGLGPGVWQELFNRENGFRFRRTIGIRDGQALKGVAVKYVVVHKDMGNEIINLYHHLSGLETPRGLLSGLAWMYTPAQAQELYGKGEVLQEWAASHFGPPVYEDNQVVVYEMASFRQPASLAPLRVDGGSLSLTPRTFADLCLAANPTPFSGILPSL